MWFDVLHIVMNDIVSAYKFRTCHEAAKLRHGRRMKNSFVISDRAYIKYFVFMDTYFCVEEYYAFFHVGLQIVLIK